jgi:anti-anti-sigma factor
VQISTRKEKKALIASVSGRMDATSAPDCQQQLLDLVNQGQSVIVLDLKELEYMSSAGLRCCLAVAKKAKSAGGGLSCCNLQSIVRTVFDISGLTTLIPILDSGNDALHEE